MVSLNKLHIVIYKEMVVLVVLNQKVKKILKNF